ncbi:hypothetical protein HUU53_02740 [Candidatus Micrarchaeota archaeon]|nr:hypothetical protein [Candidatus Micrarchaeota archaeon]
MDNQPASRGIPSKKALLFDYFDLPMSVTARWEVDDVLKLVFPPQLQKVQYDIALRLMHLFKEKEEVSGEDLSQWQDEQKIASSTLRNLVIPKLVRVGMLARERKNPTGQDLKDKRKEMVLRLSNRFGESLKHVGSEWASLTEAWKEKRRS